MVGKVSGCPTMEGNEMVQKILIIEDNEQNMILMRDVLKYHGCIVITAKDGDEGIRQARAQRPDLIIMDIQMPVMDGYAAIKIMRGDPELREMKVVACTSHAMSGDRESLLQAGFDDYMTKPVDIRQLPGMISRHLCKKE